MKILVTGGGGFLGARLIRALLAAPQFQPSKILAADVVACPVDDRRVQSRVGSVADAQFVDSLVADGIDAVYHLAAVLSGQSESDFDLGMTVNVDGTRYLLEACRRLGTVPRFVFASSVAVFGGVLPEVVPEDVAVLPQSSYGTEKAIAELLVSDYSRKRFVDGVSCRLPTVAIRPGAPNSALSSFVSGIIREPLAGIDSVCPVPLDTRLWITSPTVVTRNLVHAGTVATSLLDGHRVINLPGLSVTPREMLDSLRRLGGASARARVRCEPDERMMAIVCTWPGAFDISRPLRLGFHVDGDIDSIVREFIAQRAA